MLQGAFLFYYLFNIIFSVKFITFQFLLEKK